MTRIVRSYRRRARLGALAAAAAALWPISASAETLERFLVARSGAVAEALLSVTDGKAQRAENAIVRKAYDKLRPSGKKHVEEAIPRVGRVLERHLR